MNMNMKLTRRLLTALVVTGGVFAAGGAALAAPKAAHHNGKQLLGKKIKTNGKHSVNKKGAYEVSVDVKGEKVAGLNVKHSKKGDVQVKKYKTSKKMAQGNGLHYASYQLAQAQSLGTVYIGYAYIDDYGYEEIYWFPYEMIYDGDTGAVEYIPVY